MAVALKNTPRAVTLRRPQGRALLDVRGLTKVFPNGTLALDSVDVEVSAGELAVVLGANGSGKSTLLRCAVRLIEPTSGSVLVDGADLTQLRGENLRRTRQAIAMVFQQANLVRRRSALSNVMMGTLGRHSTWRTALGVLPDEERDHARRCLDRVGLGHVAGQRADTLSGGQAQRVAIARGLSQRAQVLLADEPVASLDPEAALEVMRLLRQLAEEENFAVLCVLHQPDLALSFGHRIIGMRRGRVVWDRGPDRVTDGDVGMLYRAEAA